MASSKMQPSFAGGEFAPSMRRRVDFAKYQVAADTMENLIVLPQGGFQARTGTQYIYSTKTAANKARLVPFSFSITQAYILEFGDYYMRVIKDGGLVEKTTSDTSAWATSTAYAISDFVVESSLVYRCIVAHTSSSTTEPGTGTDWATYWVQNSIYELYLPFSIDEIWNLKFEQSADTLIVTNPSYQRRLITRTGHAVWTISTATETKSPLMTENTTTTTLTLSNSSSDTWLYKDASVTVTASSAVFDSSHVGSVWGIRYRAYAANYSGTLPLSTDYTSDSYRTIGDWTCTIKPDSSAQLDSVPVYIEKSIDEGSTWFKLNTVLYQSGDTSVTQITGSEDDECLLRVTHASTSADYGTYTFEVTGTQMWCYFKITAYTSSTVVTATLQTNFNKGGSAYKSWAEGCWSDYRGWPRCGTFFQNRWIAGGNSYGPNSYWASTVDDYYENVVSIDQVEDESINDRLPSREVNAIEWLVPTQDLVVLTSDSEWTISPSSTSGVFSYKEKIVHQRTATGASSNCKPVIIGDSVVYLKRCSNKVQGLSYTDANGYGSTELSVLADHLFTGYTITDWAYQQNPNSILWCVRSDGALLSFTYMKEQDVWAWTHHVTDGSFESVACIPGDTQDDVYFIVNRTVNGSTVRYIEMLAERDVTDETTYIGLDCSATATRTTASTSITEIDWLIGKSVKVIADGVDIGYKTVSSTGTITLDKEATTVTVGLDFTWLFKSLSIDSGIDRKKIINSVTVSVIDSKGGMAAAGEDYDFKSLPYKETGFSTEDLVDVNLNASYEDDGRVVLKGSGASPFWCIAITPKVTSGGN